MARHYQSPEVQCPFYRMEDRHCIHCEGPEMDWTLIQEFDDAGTAKEYKRCYCHADWPQCRIARMLWAQYEDVGSLRLMRKASPFLVRGERT